MQTRLISAAILSLISFILIFLVFKKRNTRIENNEIVEISRVENGFKENAKTIFIGGWKDIPANTWIRIEFGQKRGNYSFKSYPDVVGEKLRSPSGLIKDGKSRNVYISEKTDTYIDYWIPVSKKIHFELIKNN